MSYQKFITISERGQIVLPKKVRELLAVKAQSHLKLTLSDDGKVLLEPVKGGFTSQLEGLAKGVRKEQDAVEYVRGLRSERHEK